MNMVFPVADPVTPLAAAPAILAAANLLLPHIERGQRVDAATLRAAMETAFGTSDATGAWDWKLAYEACEVATVLFLRKYGKALFRKAASPAARASVLAKIAGLLPTQTRRSEESQNFQQFSTPLPLGLAALSAVAITPDDVVLEPSAGTGLLAMLAHTAGGSLILNELTETRADLLSSLFPALSVTRFDAAQIDDHLAPDAIPSVVLMNPPFSVMANVSGRVMPMPLTGMSPRRWPVLPPVDDWSRSPARASVPRLRPGAMPLSACRNAGAWCSLPPSMAQSMRSTAPRSTRG